MKDQIKELSLKLSGKIEELKKLRYEDEYVILSPDCIIEQKNYPAANGNGGYCSYFNFGIHEKVPVGINFERIMTLLDIKSGSDVVKKSYIKNMFKIKWWDDAYWIDEESAKYHGDYGVEKFEGTPISSRIDFCEGFEDYHKNGVFKKEFEEIEKMFEELSSLYIEYCKSEKKKDIVPFITELRAQRWFDSKKEFSKNTKHDLWLLTKNERVGHIFNENGDWKEVSPNVYENKKYYTDRYIIVHGFFGYKNISEKQMQIS